MADLVLELLVSAAIALIVKAGVAFTRHWIAWDLAAVIGVVVVVGCLLAIDVPDMHRWWR